MAKITIYLPDEVEARVRKAARKEHTSVRRWIASQVIEKVNAAWPVEVLEAFGAIPDFPDAEELRRGYGEDARREPIAGR
jgi:predicted transcriptional regulator